MSQRTPCRCYGGLRYAAGCFNEIFATGCSSCYSYMSRHVWAVIRARPFSMEAKFQRQLKLLTPWYAQHVSARRWRVLFFQKIFWKCKRNGALWYLYILNAASIYTLTIFVTVKTFWDIRTSYWRTMILERHNIGVNMRLIQHQTEFYVLDQCHIDVYKLQFMFRVKRLNFGSIFQ